MATQPTTTDLSYTGMTEPYIHAFYSRRNMDYLKKQVLKYGLTREPSDSALKASMHEAKWFYDTPYQQGTAAMLDPDFGRENEPGAQNRKLHKLNAAVVRVLVDNMTNAKMTEGMYDYELSTPMGDRMLHYPQFWRHRNEYQASARFLPDPSPSQTMNLPKRPTLF